MNDGCRTRTRAMGGRLGHLWCLFTTTYPDGTQKHEQVCQWCGKRRPIEDA